MIQSKAPPIDVVSMRASEYSADGKNVLISLTTKYTSERTFSVPVQCLNDLIADLEKLKSPTVTKPAANLSQTGKKAEPIKISDQTRAAKQPARNLNQINITVPKKWMLSSGLPNHPVVILIVDPQTEAQAGYAFSHAAAREMAVGLVKYADSIAKHQADKQAKLS